MTIQATETISSTRVPAAVVGMTKADSHDTCHQSGVESAAEMLVREAGSPMLPKQHSSDPLNSIRKTVEKATKLYSENVVAKTGIEDRSATILTHCIALASLRDAEPDAFQEFKRSLGFSEGRRGSYNTAERPAREVVKVVLRFEKTRSQITRYTQALSHLLAVGPTNLEQYITDKGGINGCAKAWREHLRELKGEKEPRSESDDVPGTEDTAAAKEREAVRVDVPDKPTLFLIDEQGFTEEIPATLASRIIMQVLAKRAALPLEGR